MSERFAQLIKEKFVGQVVPRNVKVRKSREALLSKRDHLLEKYIKPINQEIRDVETELTNFCEHPDEFVSVKVTGWHDDDGEGNHWHGTTVTLKCASCGYGTTVSSGSESNGHKFNDRIKAIDLNALWDQVKEEQQARYDKNLAAIQEESERKQYEKLKKKFE